MLSQIIITFCTLAVVATSFTIPKDQPDGVYVLLSGDDTPILISNTTSARSTSSDYPSSTNSKRDSLPNNSYHTCSNQILYRPSWDSAYGEFYNYCSSLGGEYIYRTIYSKKDGVVAYMCNYGNGNPCGTQEFNDAGTRIINGCYHNGNDQQAGWVYIPDWKKSYGYAPDYASFC